MSLIHESIAKGLSDNQYASMVLRDIKSAFDKVWHDGLKYKMGASGLEDFLLRTLANYLKERKSYISFRGVEGEVFNIKAGVPQGSMISPILYNLYVKDLPDTPGYIKNYIYADDITQLIITRPNKELHNRRIVESINKVNE